MKAFKQMSR